MYLDSAASSQKPTAGARRDGRRYYETTNANVHRGVYAIAEEATGAYRGGPGQGAPASSARRRPREIVFTKNATEAHQPGRLLVGPGQPRARATSSCSPQMEHHANIVPWQMLAAERGIELRWIPLTDDGRLDLTDLDRLLDGAKLVGVTAMSNVLGTLNPVRQLADAAHAAGALVLVDGCPVRRRTSPPTSRRWAPTSSPSPATRCSARPASACCGRREELLDAMPPFLGGGEMIRDVRLDGFTPNELPVEVRGRHAADRRGDRARRRRRLPRRARHGRACGRTRWRSPPTPCDTLTERFGDDDHDPRAARRRRRGAA